MTRKVIVTTGVLLAVMFFFSSNIFGDSYTWNGATTNWFASGNWTPATVPGSGDDAVIPTTGVLSNPAINAATTIGTLTIQSGRTLTCTGNGDLTVTGNVSCAGTLKLNTNIFTCGGSADFTGGTLTHDTSTFVMNGASGINTLTLTNNAAVFSLAFTGAGTFNFGNTDVTVRGDWTQSAGTVNAPSGTLTFYIEPNSLRFTHTAGIFNHNNGTIVILNTGSPRNMTITNTTPDTFNNLTINCPGTYLWVVAEGCTNIVNGTLTLTSGGIGSPGTVEAKGSIAVASGSGAGGGKLLIDGTGDQSFTIPNGAKLPGIILNSPLTTISSAPGANVYIPYLTIQAGTFTAPSGILTMGSYSPSGFYHTAGGTFNHNNGTLFFFRLL